MPTENRAKTYVTEERCNTLHKRFWRVVNTLLILAGLLLTVAGWSGAIGYQAITKASDVEHYINVHSAAEKVKDEGIKESLIRIESEQKQMRTLLHELLRGAE